MGRGLHAESRKLIQRAYDVLAVEHPSGVRRVAYALYGNQASAMVKKLGNLLVRARKDGHIPWSWINDSTRLDVLPFVVNDVGDMRDMHRSCPSYDPWQQQPVRVLVWTEKSVGGTLEPVLDEYLVGFCVHHGNTSASKIQTVVSAMATDPRRLVILYCGDHDPKGLRISEDDLPKRFAEYGADMDRLTIRRVALLSTDAVRLREFKDAFKPNDKDVAWYRKHCGLSYGVELEAIPSTELRQRVETAIRQEIVDIGAWNQVLATSTAVRESWEAYVDKWKAPVPATRPEWHGDAVYVCACGFACVAWAEIQDHVRQFQRHLFHLRSKGTVYSCDCGFFGPSPAELQVHVQQVHPEWLERDVPTNSIVGLGSE